MNVTYEPAGINNFHNSPAINLRESGEKSEFDGPVYRISKRQAVRVENHFCGITDCHCAHGAVQQLNEDGTEFGIPAKYCI